MGGNPVVQSEAQPVVQKATGLNLEAIAQALASGGLMPSEALLRQMEKLASDRAAQYSQLSAYFKALRLVEKDLTDVLNCINKTLEETGGLISLGGEPPADQSSAEEEVVEKRVELGSPVA